MVGFSRAGTHQAPLRGVADTNQRRTIASAGVAELGPHEMQWNEEALVAGRLVEGEEQGETEGEEREERELEEGTAVDAAEQTTPRDSVRSMCVATRKVLWAWRSCRAALGPTTPTAGQV
jgi:hypothetical protein